MIIECNQSFFVKIYGMWYMSYVVKLIKVNLLLMRVFNCKGQKFKYFMQSGMQNL